MENRLSPLIALLRRVPDDALAWLQLNIEFYPNFAESYLVLSQVHMRKRDPAAALKDLEKALALDPSNVPAKRQLAELRKQRDIQ